MLHSTRKNILDKAFGRSFTKRDLETLDQFTKIENSDVSATGADFVRTAEEAIDDIRAELGLPKNKD